MPHILIVTDTYNDTNGVSAVLARLVALLEKRGLSITVAHPRMCRSIPILLYPELRLALFPRKLIRKLFSSTDFEYVHIATEGPLGLAARRYSLQHGIPFTTAYHTHWPKYAASYLGQWLSAGAYWYLRWFHNAARAVLATTPTLIRELTAHGFMRVVYWPLGVDTTFFTRMNTPEVPALEKPVFVYFGRIAREKSVEEFLQLDVPGTKLVIGDGPEREHLEKEYGTAARFVGYKHGQELIEWLSVCDVFVFPSRTETFGLVILEALSMGIPVAAHDVLGPRDIIENGVDGYLSENLADAALKCLSLSKDACRKKALAFSWEHSAEVFEKNIETYR